MNVAGQVGECAHVRREGFMFLVVFLDYKR